MSISEADTAKNLPLLHRSGGATHPRGAPAPHPWRHPGDADRSDQSDGSNLSDESDGNCDEAPEPLRLT